MRHPFIVIRTVVLIVAIWLVFGWLLWHLRWLDRRWGLVLPRWTFVLGLPLGFAGGLLVLGCGGLLSTRGILSRGGRDWLFPTEFVAFGPFRYVRNPMSLGAIILLAGIGLCGRSISILVVTLLAFPFLHSVAVLIEEPGLERRFGTSYRTYKSQVNRWLPRLPRKA